jgi:hypothetical protein
VIHAGSVISTEQPYRVIVTLFSTSRRSSRLDALAQRTLPASVEVRLSNRGSVIAAEERECYPDSTVSVSFKVLRNLKRRKIVYYEKHGGKFKMYSIF